MAKMTTGRGDNEFHCCVVGEGGVGKSAITCQYISRHFIEVYDPTIEDSYRKQTHVDGEVAVVNVLDTAGQEQYSCLREAWYRDGEGFILAYSITDRMSFLQLQEHVTQISRVRDVDNCAGVPIVIFANKCDLELYRQVSVAEGKEFADSLGAAYLEGSAKQHININESFEALVRSIREKRGPLHNEMSMLDQKKKMKKKQHKTSCNIL